MIKQTFKYIGLCVGLFMLLALIEIFLLRLLINLITTNFNAHVIIYNVLFLIINPIIIKLVIDKFFNIKLETAKTGA